MSRPTRVSGIVVRRDKPTIDGRKVKRGAVVVGALGRLTATEARKLARALHLHANGADSDAYRAVDKLRRAGKLRGRR